MGRKYDRPPVGHLVQFVDKHRPFFFQCRDNLTIMDNFVPHINRRTMQVERAIDNLDRAVNAGAKPAWISQNKRFWWLGCFGHSLVSFKRAIAL